MSEPSSISGNLLIVEDDEGLRRQYRWMFPELQLSLAGTREEAIAAVRRQVISVAIVDLGLPPSPDDPTEGLATLGTIRETSPSTKVITALLTAIGASTGFAWRSRASPGAPAR